MSALASEGVSPVSASGGGRQVLIEGACTSPVPAVHSRSVLADDMEALAQAVVDDHYRDRDILPSEHAELRVTSYLRHSGSRLWMDMCERVADRAKEIIRSSRPPLPDEEDDEDEPAPWKIPARETPSEVRA